MPVYKSSPQFQVTTSYGGSNYTFTNDQFISGVVTRIENGFDTATLFCNDYNRTNYANKLSEGSALKIEFKDASEAAWTTVLDNGIIRFVNQTPIPELLELKCDGAGYGFGETLCNLEYGTQSNHPTIDTARTILTDASYGIVPKFVNKLLGSASDTGYSYTNDNLCIESFGESIKYLYSPYKPNNKLLGDLCELLQGFMGASAGPHWLVTTGGKLLMSQIGAHIATVLAEGWTNYYGGSQAAATLVQGTDFTDSYFQRLPKEANYIVYAGALRKPANEVWTENNAASWGTDMFDAGGGGAGPCSVSNEGPGGANVTIGSYSLHGHGTNAGTAFDFYYPSTRNASWDLTKIGGEHNIPTVSFYCKVNNEIDHSLFSYAKIYMWHYEAVGPVRKAYWCGFGDMLPHDDAGNDDWHAIKFPIGKYYESAQDDMCTWYDYGGMVATDWADIDAVGFDFVSNGAVTGEVYIDGLSINGNVIRIAKTAAGYSSTNPCKMKVITDDLGKDDSLIATDVTGTIGRLCEAEYRRANTTPIVGWIQTPLLKDLWPGMLLHIHAKTDSGGTFNINKDFRVTRLNHFFDVGGYFTVSYLTDDVINSNPREGFTAPVCTDLNKLLAATRPEFQDRQASSIKAREIDITQSVLENGY